MVKPATLASRLTQVAKTLNAQWAKRRDDEITGLRQALVHRPDDLDKLLRLGRALGRNGKGVDAAETLMRALTAARVQKDRGQEAMALQLLATTQASQGDTSAALKTFEAAEKLGPLGPSAYANLGVLQLAAGQAEPARQSFSKGAKANGARALRRVRRSQPPAVARTPAGAARVDHASLRKVVGEVLDALPTANDNAPREVLPMGGSRGSAPTEATVQALLQWP